MSYQDKLLVGTPNWEIELATHIGTHLKNETSVPVVAVPLRRQRLEAEFRDLFREVRAPVHGYNCFGHVFALRRTAIYKPNVNLIVKEDGYGPVPEADATVGDVVVYSDAEGPTHVARVVKVTATNVTVLSKFDDCSGEYEHDLKDARWDQKPLQIKWLIYRERALPPQAHVPGYLGIIT